MGDILESATKNSVGRGIYSEDYPTQKQYEEAVRTFKPYADNIDLVIEGNHEERIIRDISFEIVQEFCHRIGKPEAYGKFSGIVNYRLFGGMVYSVYAWHGATNSIKESSAINTMLKMKDRVIAHIFLMGHTHKLLKLDRDIVIPNPGKDKCIEIQQMFVNTGTALDSGGYDEQKGLPMNRKGFCAIQIYANKRKQVFHHISDLMA